MLKDKGSSYEISTMDTDNPAIHTVVEVGDDYVVVRDVAGVTELRIPIFAVKAVILLRTKPG